MSYVLIVEDEAEIRGLISEGLTRLDQKVLEAENASHALEVIRTHPIKLLVTDVRMPGGDGITLLKSIKEQSLKTFPVIVMTGFSDTSPDKILTLGADQVVLKPFRFKEFLETIKSYL